MTNAIEYGATREEVTQGQQVMREQQDYPQDLLDDLKNMVKPENQERWWRTLQRTKDFLSFMALLECILKITRVDIKKAFLF